MEREIKKMAEKSQRTRLTDHQIELILYFYRNDYLKAHDYPPYKEWTRKQVEALYDDFIKAKEEMYPTPEAFEIKKRWDESGWETFQPPRIDYDEKIRRDAIEATGNPDIDWDGKETVSTKELVNAWLKGKPLTKKQWKEKRRRENVVLEEKATARKKAYEPLFEMTDREKKVREKVYKLRSIKSEITETENAIKTLNFEDIKHPEYPNIVAKARKILYLYTEHFWDYVRKHENAEVLNKMKLHQTKPIFRAHPRMHLPTYPLDEMIGNIFYITRYILMFHPKTQKYIEKREYYAKGNGRTNGNAIFPGSYIVYTEDEETALLTKNSARIFYNIDELSEKIYYTKQFKERNDNIIDFLICLCIIGLLKNEYNQDSDKYENAIQTCIKQIQEQCGRSMNNQPKGNCARKDTYQWPYTYIMKCDTCGKVIESCHKDPSAKWMKVYSYCKKMQDDRITGKDWDQYEETCKHEGCTAKYPGHLIAMVIEKKKFTNNIFVQNKK